MRGEVAVLVGLVAACGQRSDGPVGQRSMSEVPTASADRSIAKVLVGEALDQLAIEKKPVLGMTLDDVRATYGDAVQRVTGDEAHLVYPKGLDLPDAKGLDLDVELHFANHAVNAAVIRLPPAAEKPLIEALNAARGEGAGRIDTFIEWRRPAERLWVRRFDDGSTLTPYIALSVIPGP